MKKKKLNEKNNNVTKKRSKTTKKENKIFSMLKKIKNKIVGILTKEYNIGIIDILILLVVASIVSSTATGYVMNSEFEKNAKVNSVVYENALDKFISVYNEVVTKYYEEVDSNELIDAGIKGMIEYLKDKYAIYVDEEVLSSDLESTYEGIGVVTIENVVYEVYEDSSAYREGVKVGDIIVSVNGYSINKDNYHELSDKLKENDGVNEIGVLRGEEELSFKVTVETITIPTVSTNTYEVKGKKIGYVDIDSFAKNTYDEFDTKLSSLEKEGIDGLIIDLRNNSGGYVKSSFDIASDFIEKDKVIYSLKSKDEIEEVLDETEKVKSYKVVVLVNKSTASSAEILAAALKDSYGADIVGNQTYGKGSVQTVKYYEDTAIKYTSAIWLRPNGESVDGVGITPDYDVSNVIKNNALEDKQFDKALQLFN